MRRAFETASASPASFRTAIAVWLILPLASPAFGLGDLDQFQLASDQSMAMHSNISLGQSMTVGFDGTLDAIELSLFLQGSPTQDMVVSVLDMSGGDFATAPSLGSVNVEAGEIVGVDPDTLDEGSVTGTLIDLSSLGIVVERNDPIAFEFTSDTVLPNNYTFRRLSTGDPYDGGVGYIGTSPTTTADLTFKLFVVPEPLGPLDQYQLDGDANQAIHSSIDVGQSFTVGADGILDAVELCLATSQSPTEDLLVEILDMAGGDYATAPVLGSRSVSPDEIGPYSTPLDAGSVTATLIDLDFLGVPVSEGDAIALHLSSETVLPSTYTIRRMSGEDLYADGTAYIGTSAVSGDYSFKVFITAPEPSITASLAASLLTLAGLKRAEKPRRR